MNVSFYLSYDIKMIKILSLCKHRDMDFFTKRY